jgi:hypothetical protein
MSDCLSHEGSAMPLPEFGSEKEFRETWIAPFLSKMGFILPKHVHGQDEQGKDFFFADHDRFGHLRVYSAQAKLGDIGTGSDLTGVMDQVERSFEVTLKYHKGSHDQRIAAVYLMANGSISPQARERISDRCRQRTFGENVYFLDGETLDNLERHVTYQQDSDLRRRLVALRNELDFNLTPAKRLIDSRTDRKLSHYCFRTLALQEMFLSPLPEAFVSYELLSKLWAEIDLINRRFVSKNLQDTPEMVLSLKHLSEALSSLMTHSRDACDIAINKLDMKYSLSLQIISTTT